jgi:hypothetical protein
MDKYENNLLEICWKGALIVNSIILIKNYSKIKNVFYEIYSGEINNIIFKGICYTANFYAYITKDKKLDNTAFTYKCVYDNGVSNNMIRSRINISDLYDKSIESNNLLDIVNNFDENPDFFIFEFVKNEKKYGLIVDKFQENIDINTNNELLFLSVTLKHNNNEYNIDLNNPVNYYVKSNTILGNKFVKYYMNEYFNIQLTDDYKIEIMDKSLNIIHLTDKNYINITDGSYTLKNVISTEKEEITELIEEIIEHFEISNQDTDNQETDNQETDNQETDNQETDNLQINIADYSPISNHSIVSNLSPVSNISPVSNPSPSSIRSPNNYLNRKCGICREVGHTRKKCPKAALPF